MSDTHTYKYIYRDIYVYVYIYIYVCVCAKNNIGITNVFTIVLKVFGGFGEDAQLQNKLN